MSALPTHIAPVLPLICYCGALMTRHQTLKFRYADGRPREFFACSRRGCDGLAGLHADGGLRSTPADKALRKLRSECHERFDRLWKWHRGYRPLMSRTVAYAKLAIWMELPRERAHIGFFDEAQCRLLLELLDGFDLRRDPPRQGRRSNLAYRQERRSRRLDEDGGVA